MKKIIAITILLTLFAYSLVGYSFAAGTPTPNPTQAQTISQTQQSLLNDLSQSIASKVAQLKLVNKEGIIGMVTDTSNTQITIKDMDGNIHFIDVDELTKFSSDANSTFGISDVTKNMNLGILGLYNKESRRILARFVTVLTFPQYLSGAIAAIDKTNFTVTVVGVDGKQTIVEIQDITKTTAYDNAAIARSGFSKMQLDERIYVVGYQDKQNPKQILASRIILFPALAINPAIGTALPALPTDTPTPAPTGNKQISQ